MLAQNISELNIPWHEPPLNSLTQELQLQLQQKGQSVLYTMGQKLWTNINHSHQQVILIVSGEVRLLQEKRKSPMESGASIRLQAGDWVGEPLQLLGEWKARAVSREVVAVVWELADWKTLQSPDVMDFWAGLCWKYQPLDPNLPHPFSGYPYLFHLNSGAACLAMLTEQFKSPVSFGQIVGQIKGQTPDNVACVAEKLGLQMQHIRTSRSKLPYLSYPALMHWEQKRWVVVYEVGESRMVIADPINHRKTCESLPWQMVEAAWDGQLWLVEPLGKADKFNLRWFLPVVWRYRKLMGEVLLASLVLQLMGLATPVITQVIIDKAIANDSLSTLNVMGIALLLVIIFETGLGMLRLFIFSHTARRIDLSLSSHLFRHLLQLPLAYFEARRTGDTVARVQELENIRQFLTGTALTVILDSLFTVVYLGLMFIYSPKLTLVSLAVIPPFVTLIVVVTPILRDWLNESFNRHADSQSFLVETICGIHAVKAHTAQIPTRARWEGLFARYVRSSFKALTLSNMNSSLSDFLTHLSELLILWFGAKMVMDTTTTNHFTIGQLVAFQTLSGRTLGPILRLAQLWQSFQQVLLSVNRIGDILNNSPEAMSESGVALPKVKGKVSFEEIVFRYQSDKEPALRGVSFDIEPGTFVGIVGRSGSGKSTLSKVLQRMYETESGRILIDGFDIQTANLTSLRQHVGVVLQEDFLFKGSVMENIILGNPDISPEEAMKAAELAAAQEFICELPDGYDTIIGERGSGLSGGQRQRLTLTRLFLSQAPILVLDEATSALDSETERKVLDNLQTVAANRTVLMITHRFAPLKRAEKILVMEKGVLIEQGCHEELLDRKGIYYALYEQQLAAI